MSRALSEEIIERARAIRENGANWKQIGDRLNCSVDAIRRRIDPEYSQHRNELVARRKRYQSRPRFSANGNPIGRPLGAFTAANAAGLVVSSSRPPAEVVADRDWRRAQDLTLNQLLLGDPEPGRSVLERGVTADLGGRDGRDRPKPWDPRSKLRSVPDFAEG